MLYNAYEYESIHWGMGNKLLKLKKLPRIKWK